MLKLEKKRGTITVDDEVIQNIVSSTAGNCFGIAGMEAKNATEQFWDLFRKDNGDKGIKISCENNQIYIDLHIMVSYGINIPAITDSIVHKISYNVEDATDFPVKKVNVFVDRVNTK